MAYGYNAQGQIVWTDDAAPQGGTALPSSVATQGQFIPGQARDYMKDDPVGAGLDEIMGGAPEGKHFTQNGDLVNDSFLDKLGDHMPEIGLAATVGGPMLQGALGGGGVQSLAFAGQPAATTPTWQTLLAKTLPGVINGARKGGWKGALLGGLEGAASSGGGPDVGVINNLTDTVANNGATLGGGGGMNWLDVLKNVVGMKSSAPTTTDPGMSSGSTWQSILGNILKGTGTAGKVAGTIGDVATGIEEGRSKDRSNQNDWNLTQDRNRLSANQNYENALENRAALELKQKGFQQEYEGTAYKNALLGALGKNMQDVSVGGVPSDVPVIHFSGGSRPSAIGPEGRAAAALMNSKAMNELQNGVAFTALPDIEKFTPSEYKSGNAIDTILGGAGTIGKIGDIWNARGQAGASQDIIKQIQDALNKQKGVAVPTGPDAPQKILMIDPQTGKPILQDQADDAAFGGASQRKPLPTPDDYSQWGE